MVGRAHEAAQRREAAAGGAKIAVAPEGAYYVLADFSELSDLPAPEFARWLTVEGGIATVPGTSFFSRPEDGLRFTRFAFCKTLDLLREASRRLQALPAVKREK